jgi:hypothetical protein
MMDIFPQFNFNQHAEWISKDDIQKYEKKKCSLLLIVTGLDGKSNVCFLIGSP